MQLPLIGKVYYPSRWLVGILVFASVAGGAIALFRLRQSPQKLDISAITIPVEAQTLTLEISASGVIQPIQSVNLSPKTAGRLEALYVEQGDQVVQGQLIAKMESAELEAQMIQAQGRLAQAEAGLAELKAGTRTEEIAQAKATVTLRQAQIVEARSRLTLASERAERNQALAREGAIARDQLDEVLNELRRAQANLEQTQASSREAQKRLEQLQQGPRSEEIAQAAAQVKEAQGQLQTAEVQLRDTGIRAPFTGIITQKYAEPGAFVTPTTSASSVSSATSTAIVAIARDLEALADVPEVDIAQVHPNQLVKIIADAYPDQTFEGRVKLIAPEAIKEQNVTSFQVRIALESGQEKLKSGMNVDLRFVGSQLKNALVVPTAAIVTKEGQTGLLVPDADNQPQFRAVILGSSLGTQTQVLKGVSLGERIFTDLPKGQKLEKILKTNLNP
jgi:HlyD family secretion protein